MQRIATVGVILLLVTVPIGSAAAAPTPSSAGATANVTVAENAPINAHNGHNNTTDEAPPDPETDVIGWENGYWHNESIDVNQSDGLNDSEMEAYVSRSMARVEHLRGLEFKDDVPVDVISREKYEQRRESGDVNVSHSKWNNQVWEALFITGEHTNITNELQSTYSSSVAGFYSPRNDSIKIITPTPDEPTIDSQTLHHELVHALQDQHFNMSSPRYRGATQDANLASDGLTEGSANYIGKLYSMRCESGEWECVPSPSSDSSSDGPDNNIGVLLTIYFPYASGPDFVYEEAKADGWERIDEWHQNPPESSEQVIHRTDEDPAPLEYTDRSSDQWAQFQHGYDTAGEASIYMMFWYQSRQHGAAAVDVQSIADNDDPFGQYQYKSEPSAGWGNDKIVPYKNGDGEYGYVWETKWDTKQDAQEFYDAYQLVLDAHAAESVDGEPNTYVIEDGTYADAFRVVQDGKSVTIVNAPSVDQLNGVREPQSDDSTTSTSANTSSTNATSSQPTDSTQKEVPGFTALVGLVAVLGALFVGNRRRD